MVQIKAKAIDGQMEQGRVLTTTIANWEKAHELDPKVWEPPRTNSRCGYARCIRHGVLLPAASAGPTAVGCAPSAERGIG